MYCRTLYRTLHQSYGNCIPVKVSIGNYSLDLSRRRCMMLRMHYAHEARDGIESRDSAQAAKSEEGAQLLLIYLFGGLSPLV